MVSQPPLHEKKCMRFLLHFQNTILAFFSPSFLGFSFLLQFQFKQLKMLGMAAEAVTTMAVVAVAGWLLFGVEGRQPVLHRVGGGKYTWTPNINFTDWSIHEHFYVGDWLCKLFIFFSFWWLYEMEILAMGLCYLNSTREFWSGFSYKVRVKRSQILGVISHL